MNKSESIAQLSTALAKAQGEIKDPEKGRKGYEGRYSYADLADMLEAARPVLSKHGLSIIQLPAREMVPLSIGGEVRPVPVIGCSTVLCHESGEYIESEPLMMPIEDRKGMSRAQCEGTVLTYCRKYSLAAVIGFAQSDEDEVGDGKKGGKKDLTDEAKGIMEARMTAWRTKVMPKLEEAANAGSESLTAALSKLSPAQLEALGEEAATELRTKANLRDSEIAEGVTK